MNTLRLLIVTVALSTFALADQLTFSFLSVDTGGVHNITASQAAGFNTVAGVNVSVSDSDTGASMPLVASNAFSTGSASTFLITTSPNLVFASFNAGAPNSITITDYMTQKMLLTGNMNGNASLLAAYPGGNGAFLSTFTVTFVDPAILADFGLNHGFYREGIVAMTFGQNEVVNNQQLQSLLGGGTITINAPTEVPEPATLALFSPALLIPILRRRIASRAKE